MGVCTRGRPTEKVNRLRRLRRKGPKENRWGFQERPGVSLCCFACGSPAGRTVNCCPPLPLPEPFDSWHRCGCSPTHREPRRPHTIDPNYREECVSVGGGRHLLPSLHPASRSSLGTKSSSCFLWLLFTISTEWESRRLSLISPANSL